MLGVNRLVTFCFLASVSCIHCALPPTSFAKNGNSYESLYNYASGAEQSPPPGYFELAGDAVSKYDKSEIPFQELNKFGLGLDQLFLFKFLQKTYEDEISNYKVHNANNGEPVTVPDFNDDSSGLVFKELIVYSFPVYKKGPKAAPNHDALNSASEYKISSRYFSDNAILTGSVYIEGSKYFFLYRVSSPVYYVEVRMRRNPWEVISAKKSFSYNKEDYVHTYDSSYVNSSAINGIVNEIVVNKLLPYVLNELSRANSEELKSQVLGIERNFVRTYEKLILDALTISALKYVKGQVRSNDGNDTFVASDIVFNVASPGAALPFQQKTENIQFKGFLNYQGKPKLVYDNTSISDGGRLYNMSQGFEFEYAEDGDKVAVVSFVFYTGRKAYPKEFKVKKVTFISEYLGELNKKPLQVYRNKEVFFNKAGFLIRFDTYNEDPIYDYVLKHMGNDIARKIQVLIEGPNSPE